jgi:hypothetical protein
VLPVCVLDLLMPVNFGSIVIRSTMRVHEALYTRSKSQNVQMDARGSGNRQGEV